jgi:hypothetical protein
VAAARVAAVQAARVIVVCVAVHLDAARVADSGTAVQVASAYEADAVQAVGVVAAWEMLVDAGPWAEEDHYWEGRGPGSMFVSVYQSVCVRVCVYACMCMRVCV